MLRRLRTPVSEGFGITAPLFFFFLLSLPLILPESSLAVDRAVRVGIYENPPLVFRGPDGRYHGFMVDLLEAIAAGEGWKLSYVEGTWPECLARLNAGQIDLLTAIAYSRKRARRFDFNRETVMENWGRLYVRPDSGIESILDLQGKTVAILKGDIHAGVFQELLSDFDLKVKLLFVEAYDTVLKDVEEKKADAGVINRLFALGNVRRYPRLKETAVIFNPIEVHYAAPKGRNRELLAAIDSHLTAWKQDPDSLYYRSIEKCFCGPGKVIFPKWVRSVFLFGSVLILFFLTMTLVLKARVRARTAELSARNRELQAEIAEREKLQAQLFQSQKMESVGKLAGGVAHDFNNLLSTILGYTELLLMDLSPKGAMREQLEMIRQAGERAASLTRQLLAFSRKQVLEVRPINLSVLVENLARMLRRMIGEDVVVELETPHTIRNVLADPGQIEQVLMNLAVNARDAMPEGGRLLIETAEMELDDRYAAMHKGVRPGRYVLLAVTDNGEGMSPEVRERIFEPFFTTKELGRGTGLGLATVYGIIKQHKGYIWVYSEPGRGSTFKIYLPVTEEKEEESTSSSSVALPKGTETVLVVDDEPSIRKLVVDTLIPLGYSVLEAADGEKALRVCRSADKTVDLLLTDLIMPGMNGRDLADSIRQIHPGIRVIFMSGYTENMIVHQGVLEPKPPFLQKPVTPRSLAVQVRSVLDGIDG